MTMFANALSQQLETQYPFWQAPMPFNLIDAKTSGQISAHGALGMIRIAAHDGVESLSQQIDKFQLYHQNLNFCFAHHLPHQQIAPSYSEEAFLQLADMLSWQADCDNLPNPSHFEELLSVAISVNPKMIGFANGIPDEHIIQSIKEQGIVTFAICHNLPEMIAADAFGIDAIVVQGMEAGGERCYFDNGVKQFNQPALTLLQQARKYIDKPIIYWGDLSSAADMVAAIISGASYIMLDRPCLACEENGLSDYLRDTAAYAHEFSSVVNARYTQHPMRYVQTKHMPTDDYLEAWLREGYYHALFKKSPYRRPIPVSLTPIEDMTTIADYLQTMEAQLKEYIA